MCGRRGKGTTGGKNLPHTKRGGGGVGGVAAMARWAREACPHNSGKREKGCAAVAARAQRARSLPSTKPIKKLGSRGCCFLFSILTTNSCPTIVILKREYSNL